MKKKYKQTIDKLNNHSPLSKILFKMLSNISHGSLKVITPDGKHHNFSGLGKYLFFLTNNFIA